MANSLMNYQNYFICSTSRSVRSDKTLRDLRSKIDSDQISENKHAIELKELSISYEKNLFPKFYKFLSKGFNIIIHGLGSKRKLLENFRTQYLINEYHFVIQGYLNDITYTYVSGFLDKIFKSDNKESSIENIYLLVHSIDIFYSSNRRLKTLLDNFIIRNSKRIHLIASLDHVNSALLWTSNELNEMNLIWFNCPTFESYHIERGYSHVNNLKDTNFNIDSIINVYQSTTPNAQKIFLLILEYYNVNNINNKANSNKTNLNKSDEDIDIDEKKNTKQSVNSNFYTFTQLYYDCLEAFLVNSEALLNNHLMEFKDHKLIRSKTRRDGTEQIELLIPHKLIPEILEEIKVAQDSLE